VGVGWLSERVEAGMKAHDGQMPQIERVVDAGHAFLVHVDRELLGEWHSTNPSSLAVVVGDDEVGADVAELAKWRGEP
jgi:hypothetical protein